MSVRNDIAELLSENPEEVLLLCDSAYPVGVCNHDNGWQSEFEPGPDACIQITNRQGALCAEAGAIAQVPRESTKAKAHAGRGRALIQ